MGQFQLIWHKTPKLKKINLVKIRDVRDDGSL